MMKRVRKVMSILLSIVIIILITTISSLATETTESSHRHSMLYNFDEDTMQVYGVYEGNLIEHLILDVQTFSGDEARVFADGQEVFVGELQEGMIVQIYHSSELYGEYEISELLQPYSQTGVTNGLNNTTLSVSAYPARAASNSYGFILPIDNMTLADNVSYGFGSNYGGPDTSYSDHRGIDIVSGGSISNIYGMPIRAVKDGTVEWTQTWDGYSRYGTQSWGNCVRISHSDGVTTLYAHMNATPLVASGVTISQGQIIGYVGDSGNAFGYHLHLEVAVNGTLVNPATYLTGASTYTDTTTRAPKTLTGDVNGDGYDDIIEMRAVDGKRQLVTILGSSSGSVSGTVITTATTNKYVDDDPIFVGDVNGDGRADVIVHFASNGKRAFVIYTGKTNGSFNNAVRIVTTNTHDTSIYPCKFLVDDFTGDGKDDFLVHYRDTNGTRSNHLYKGNSSGGFNTAIKTTSERKYIENDPVFAADVNGDACCDVIVHWASNEKRQLLTYKGNTTGSFSTPVNFATENAQTSAYENKFFIGDFNGDGRDDFLVHWSSGNGGSRNLLLYRGNSSCSFEVGIHTYTGSTNITNDPILIGDVNGDDIDDVIVEYSSESYRAFNVYAGTSTGTFANKVVTVTTNLRNSVSYPSRIMVSDITNDGSTDAIVVWRSTDGKENVIVYKGLSTKQFSTGVKTKTNQEYYFSY